MPDWRRRLYDSYVSSGQGGGDSSKGYRSGAPYINQLIQRHIPADRNISILDLGCGTGGVIYWLKRAGYEKVSGIDFSPEMVAAAHAAGVNEVRLDSIQAALNMTESQCLDVVLVMDVLEHMEREVLFEMCDEIFRVLKPGGRIIAHVPNAAGIFGASILYGDLTHQLAFTSSSMQQLLHTVGFREVKCYEDKPVTHGLKSGIRAFLWHAGTVGFRVLHVAETGTFRGIMSQNLLATAVKTA